MIDKPYLVFPLAAALLYAIGALFLKSAERRGISVYQITILANIAAFAAFAGLFYPWQRLPAVPEVWWPVLAVGLTFVVGQVTAILAFARGEVSVATPALGTKVVIVAAIASVFGTRPVRPETWVAAVLMLLGLWLLVGRPAAADARRATIAVVFSLISAFAFACFDVLVEVWGKRLGFGLLVPPGMLIACVLSVPMLWLGGGGETSGRASWSIPRVAWRPLLLGIAMLTAQAILLVWSIGHFRDAAGANVVYASRGIWSVLLVQLLPVWFGKVERFASRGVFVRRIAGSTVMMIGVFLAFA